MESFELARQSFLANLGPQDKVALDAADPVTLFDDIHILEQRHKDKSLTRRLLQKAEPLIRRLERYGKALDVISQAKPEVLSLLWGGIRIVLHLAQGFLEIYEKLLNMLHQMGRELESFETYARLYPKSQRLKSSLVDAYEAFLAFCLATKKLLSKDLKSSKFSGGIKDALKPMRISLKREFSNASDRLIQITDSVREDASLAEKEAAAEARDRNLANAKVEEHRLLFAWLDPADSKANYQAAMDLCEPGTGQWIFETDQFRSWASSRDAALWLHAKPGAGKTILASTVITHLRQQSSAKDHIVVYYFYDYKDIKTQSPLKMFETLLAEICRQSPDALAFLSSQSEKYREFNSTYSISILRQMFLDCLSTAKCQQIHIVIDALDECNDRMKLLEQLHLIIGAGSQLKIFMTSREEVDLKKSLGSLPQLSLSGSGTTGDIRLYIEHQLEKLITSGELRFRNPILKDEIRDALSAKADGMFQYVKCQLETLCGAPSDKWIRAALQDFPIGLDETYVRILERIRARFPRDVQIIRNIFFWLVHSLRPLSGQELTEATFFSVNHGYLDFEAIPLNPDILLQYSGGLFKIVDQKGTIGLAHFSVKMFLLSTSIKHSPVREFFAGDPSVLPSLTMLCVDYLKLADFNCGQCFTEKQLSTRKNTYKFFTYAASQWMVHYRQLRDDEATECDAKILDFLIQPTWAKNVFAWQQVLREGRWGDYLGYSYCPRCPVVHPLDPIHHAAAHGLWRLTRMLLENGSDPNAQGGQYGHPILTAAFNWRYRSEQPSIWSYILNLLDSGANIKRSSFMRKLVDGVSKRWTPDDLGFLQKLVVMGAFEKCPEELGTFLRCVARHPSDSQDAARFLLDSGADANHSYKFADGVCNVSRPLQLACKSGNWSIAKLLLARGASLNFDTTDSGTPLQAAVIGCNPKIVSWLLERQADPNISGGILGTPLQAAAWYRQADIIRALLDGGADVNVNGGYFGSPLAAAIADGNQEVIDLILQREPDPNRHRVSFDHYPWNFSKPLPRLSGVECEYMNPIDWAIKHGNVNLVSRLSDFGAQLNPEVACWCTPRVSFDTGSRYHPLCFAIMSNNTRIMDLLLERGSDPATGGYCAVQRAALSGNFDVFEKLLIEARDIDITQICSRAFFFCGNDTFAVRLLDFMRRKEVQVLENLKGLLLHRSAKCDSLVRVRYLLEMWANPDISCEDHFKVVDGLGFDFCGSTILSYAIDQLSAAMVELLITKGADVNIHDPDRGCPLLAALDSSEVLDKNPSAILLDLLERGARPDEPIWPNGSRCSVVLHEAVGKGNVEAVELLLEYGADIERVCDWHGTVLMRAVTADDAEMVKHLVNKGASLDKLDVYGQTLHQRAHEECCFEALEVLSSLGVPPEASQSAVQAQIEATVAALTQELSNMQGQDKWELESLRWTTLGRCLWLGHDSENAIIALEQSILRKSWCHRCTPWYGPCCFRTDSTVQQHLCKYGTATVICEAHLEDHLDELRQLGRLEAHESITFPRPIFYDTPKGQVVFNDGSLRPWDEWLKDLRGWKVKSSEDSSGA